MLAQFLTCHFGKLQFNYFYFFHYAFLFTKNIYSLGKMETIPRDYSIPTCALIAMNNNEKLEKINLVLLQTTMIMNNLFFLYLFYFLTILIRYFQEWE